MHLNSKSNHDFPTFIFGFFCSFPQSIFFFDSSASHSASHIFGEFNFLALFIKLPVQNFVSIVLDPFAGSIDRVSWNHHVFSIGVDIFDRQFLICLEIIRGDVISSKSVVGSHPDENNKAGRMFGNMKVLKNNGFLPNLADFWEIKPVECDQ